VNWKKFKNLDASEKTDESMFILGIDVGDDSSAIAFYDQSRGAAELIDISGGYGRPSVPTVMQYISETKEWVFGEYAVLNKGQGQEITMDSLMEKLGRGEYLEIDKRPVAVVNVIGLFLREIIGSVKNINPKAEIAGIVASVPCYLSQEAKDELHRAFVIAGYDRELIALKADRECVFGYHIWKDPNVSGNVLLLDYGSREMRGGLYRIAKAGACKAKSLSSLFRKELGTRRIDAAVMELLLAGIPESVTDQAADHMDGFLYRHKDLLFRKANRLTKLYYNFIYPPVMRGISKDSMDDLIFPFRNMLLDFIQDILSMNVTGAASASDVKYAICTGGGFEMPWAKDVLADVMPEAVIVMTKNPKSVVAEGAALLAAAELGLLDGKGGIGVEIEDGHQVPVDIGLYADISGREKFVPIVERNSFWWQNHPEKFFIIAGEKPESFSLDLLTRSAEGETGVLESVSLDGLPARPKGTSKLSVGLKFDGDRSALATIKDEGFGDIYPKTGFVKTVRLNI